LPAPSRADVAQVALRTAGRIDEILKKHGRARDPGCKHSTVPSASLKTSPRSPPATPQPPRGIALSGDRAGQPSLRLVLPAEPPPSADLDPSDPVAEVRGVNVHARQWVHGNAPPRGRAARPLHHPAALSAIEVIPLPEREPPPGSWFTLPERGACTGISRGSFAARWSCRRSRASSGPGGASVSVAALRPYAVRERFSSAIRRSFR
jgi:hypothetical protein